MWRYLLLVPCFLFSEREPMLFEAEKITSKYGPVVVKTAPPSLFPKPMAAASQAPVWFSIDLSHIQGPAFQTLSEESLWNFLKEIGVRGVYLQGLKQGGNHRTGLGIDPCWGHWIQLQSILEKSGIALISDGLGPSSGMAVDFCLALQNVGEFPDLYHLIEIDSKDWNLLPKSSQQFTNIPWLTLSQLHKKGYVPEQFSPYVKESSWNATAPIRGKDQKVRRWIYLKEDQKDPVFNFMSSSFAASRILSSDILESIFHLNQKVVCLDQKLGENALQTLSLWTRKLGGFSALKKESSLPSWKKASTDLIFDTLSPSLLLHAAETKDAEVLALFYRLLLREKIDPQKLIHALQPFESYPCDYPLLMQEKKNTVQYHEEILTQEALRQRLLKQDVFRLIDSSFASWPRICSQKENFDFEKALHLHLLFAFFYAMQPGVFSFSVSDLLGLTEQETVDPLLASSSSLYGSLSSQMRNQCSFAQRLRSILSIRNQLEMEKATLLGVLPTRQKGALILLHKMEKQQMLQMLAINFGAQNVEETFDLPSIKGTSAINLVTQKLEEKPVESSLFTLRLEPLSGKAILFQTKYYD